MKQSIITSDLFQACWALEREEIYESFNVFISRSCAQLQSAELSKFPAVSMCCHLTCAILQFVEITPELGCCRVDPSLRISIHDWHSWIQAWTDRTTAPHWPNVGAGHGCTVCVGHGGKLSFKSLVAPLLDGQKAFSFRGSHLKSWPPPGAQPLDPAGVPPLDLHYACTPCSPCSTPFGADDWLGDLVKESTKQS